MLSEISQAEKTNTVISLIHTWKLKKKNQIHRVEQWLPGAGVRVGEWEMLVEVYKLSVLRQILSSNVQRGNCR